MNEDEGTTPVTPEPGPTGEATPISSDERMWAMFGHLAALLAFVITCIGGVVGPLIVWLVKRDTMPFAGEQALEALNFNITVLIVAAGLVVFGFVTLGLGFLIAGPLLVVVAIVWLILTIVATLKANAGEHYRYPFTWRLVH
jgi:uncharacterized Tic20 family protein